MNNNNFSIKHGKYGEITAIPLPNPEKLSAFYADTYFQESVSKTYSLSYDEEEITQRQMRANLMIYALAKHDIIPIKGELFLDIGCGEGFLLEAARLAGYNIHGVDFSSAGITNQHPHLAKSVETGNALPILEDMANSGKQCKVCTLLNVLEHVIEPTVILRAAKNLLMQNGVILITVPNDYSPVQLRLKKKKHIDRDYWFSPPQHLHYFNLDTLTRFVESQDFTVIDAFSDFPIDFFLFHPGSNYILDSTQGKAAHRARIELDLILSEKGQESYLDFCRSLAACGGGRNLTIIIKPTGEEDD